LSVDTLLETDRADPSVDSRFEALQANCWRRSNTVLGRNVLTLNYDSIFGVRELTKKIARPLCHNHLSGREQRADFCTTRLCRVQIRLYSRESTAVQPYICSRQEAQSKRPPEKQVLADEPLSSRRDLVWFPSSSPNTGTSHTTPLPLEKSVATFARSISVDHVLYRIGRRDIPLIHRYGMKRDWRRLTLHSAW
jgi:hypothetical protein